MALSFSQVKNNSRRNEYIWNKHKVQEKNIVLFCCRTNIFEWWNFEIFWNLKEFLKKVHYSSYFEGLFITWKNCFERTKHNISFFFFSTFLKCMNRGSSSLCQIFLHLSFPCVFFKINFFFSREEEAILFTPLSRLSCKVTKGYEK